MFIDNLWCLYKKIKYNTRLIEYKQDNLKFKMINMLSRDYNIDAALLQKSNDDLCN